MKIIAKLKAKKGFTLVELIVVVAIIGVLAAVLIPTMIGAVRESRVNTANMSASSIREKMNVFLTQADIGGYGMGTNANSNAIVEISITGNKEWRIAVQNPGAFATTGEYKWTGAGRGTASDENPANAECALAVHLANIFTDVNNAGIVAYLNAGKVVYVAYADNVTAQEIMAADGSGAPPVVGGGNDPYVAPDDGLWGGSMAGYTQKGFCCGTSPIIPLRKDS